MHEYSIVQALLTQCEEIALQNEAEAVTKIIVKIGKMSGVEPHLLEIAFNTFKEGTMCSDADFVMNIQPLVVECKECGCVSELTAIDYHCLECHSNNLQVIDGEDMYLMTLEVE